MSAAHGFRSLTWRLVFWVLGTCGLIYLGTMVYAHFLSRDIIVRGAEREALDTARASINEIEEVLRSLEEATQILGGVLEIFEPSQDDLEQLLRAFVASDPRVYGSAAAFSPFGFHPSMERFSPYYHRQGEDVVYADLADDSYRYWEWEWYTEAAGSGQPRWSEPYVDEGGGNILMVTYSVPFYRWSDGGRELKGVVTADLSLEWLNDLVRSIQIGRTGYGVILSKQGRILSHPDQDLMKRRRPVFEMEGVEPAPEVAEILRLMLEGGSGFRAVDDRFLSQRARLTYAPVGSAGWSLAVIYPEDELMEEVNRVFRNQLGLLVLGLAVLVGVVWILSRHLTRPVQALASSAGRIATGDLDSELPPVRSRDEIGALTSAFHNMRDSLKTYIRDLQVTTAAKERLESELQIARKIQMDMLPEGQLGGGENDAYELAAQLVPARAVGGDLYYHFQAGGRIYFIVGDVSGKGVPAALFMARTKTLFETIAVREPDVGATLTAVNRSLCRENDAGMFVTVFAGALDGATGEVTCAAGGHDPPAWMSGTGKTPSFVEMEGGPVLGLLGEALFPTNRLVLSRDDCLVLYTDGVSEALDEDGEFFTSERLLDFLSRLGPSSAGQVTEAVMDAVKDFAGRAQQSDDITVMTLRYTPGQPSRE